MAVATMAAVSGRGMRVWNPGNFSPYVKTIDFAPKSVKM